MKYPLVSKTGNNLLVLLSLEQADILFKLADKELYELDNFLWEDYKFDTADDDIFRQAFSQQLHAVKFNQEYTEVYLYLTIDQALILLKLLQYNINFLEYQGHYLFTNNDNEILGRPMAIRLYKLLKPYLIFWRNKC